MDGVQLTREALYDLVWSEPLQKAARRFGISDVMLAKYCKKMEVPRPGRGYWQRLAAGQRVNRPPLPEPKGPKVPKVCVIGGQKSARAIHLIDSSKSAAAAPPAPEVPVQPTLTAPHEFVRRTLTALERAKPGDNGLLWAPAGPGILDVSVSRGLLDRALRIMDALIKAVESRGGRVLVESREGSASEKGTFVEIAGQRLGIRLRELVDRTPHVATQEEKVRQRRDPWFRIPEWDHAPSGRLALEIRGLEYLGLGLRQRWVDGTRQRLEGCIGKFVVALEQAAQAKRAHDEEMERRRREWAEEERRRALERLKREQEQARRQRLIQEAELWETAQRVARYVTEVERQARVRGMDTGPDSPLGRWLAWARSVASQLDPASKRLAETASGGPDIE